MANHEFLKIGKIVSVHGIRGEVKVQPWCDSLDDFLHIPNVYLDVTHAPLDVDYMRVHKNNVLIKFCGIDFRDRAEDLVGRCLYAKKCDIPIEDDHYFIEDLKNSEVFDFETGKKYGVLKDVWNTGANDIYTIVDDGGKEYYVPIIEGTVKEIDLQNEKILICPLKGIFD